MVGKTVTPVEAERRSAQFAKLLGYAMDPVEEVARKYCHAAGKDPDRKDAQGCKAWLAYVKRAKRRLETVSAFDIRRGRV